MNKIPLTSTQRNSVNSSFSTVKNCEFSSFCDTANKQIQPKRFSYQEINSHQQTWQKQNMRINSIAPLEMSCVNHGSKLAMFTALETSDDPMYLCQRCAIMVASKGFQITKIQEKKMKKYNPLPTEFKKEASDTFANLKLKKNQTVEKLNIFAIKLEKKAQFIQSYFNNLQEYIQRQRYIFLKQINTRKREIENLRQQSNNFYLNSLQRVKQISMETSVSQCQISDLSKQLKDLRKNTFNIIYQQLKYPMQLKNINQLCQDLSILIRQKDPYKKLIADMEFKMKCEQQNSQIRSLQLSFEEENNFTLNAQETNRTGQL